MKFEKGFHEDDDLAYYYSRKKQNSYQFKIHFVNIIMIKIVICYRYLTHFPNKNRLYKHLDN